MELTYVGGAAVKLVRGLGRVKRGQTVKVSDSAQCKSLLAQGEGEWQRAKQTPEKQTTPEKPPADPPKAATPKESD